MSCRPSQRCAATDELKHSFKQACKNSFISFGIFFDRLAIERKKATLRWLGESEGARRMSSSLLAC